MPPAVKEDIVINVIGDNKLLRLVNMHGKLNSAQKKGVRESQAMNIASGRLKEKYTHLTAGQARGIIKSKETEKVLGRQKEFANNLGISYTSLNSELNKMGWTLGRGNILHDQMGKKIKDQSRAQGQLVGNTKRFRMELLSVMFFGMAVSRMFASMTKGSLEASGAVGVWGALTMLMGLPAATSMTDVTLGLLNAFTQLSPGMQTAVSWTLYLGQAAGTALMSFGMFGLGIQGILKLFPKWAMAVTNAGGIFKWFNGVMGGTVSMISKIGMVIVLLTATFRAIAGYLKGDWIKWVTGIILAVGAIVALVLGGWIPALIVGVVALFIWLGDKVTWVGQLIMTILSPLTYLVALFMKLGEALRTGEWKGFWGDVHELGRQGTFWAGKAATPLATGGIVTRPTMALIGEKGPEAVIPLSGGGGGIGTFAPTININANIAHDLDINHLANRINELMIEDMRRHAA